MAGPGFTIRLYSSRSTFSATVLKKMKYFERKRATFHSGLEANETEYFWYILLSLSEEVRTSLVV